MLLHSVFDKCKFQIWNSNSKLLRILYFSKNNVRAFIIVLGITMKAVGFESYPEVNGFVEKFVMKDKC